MLLLLFELLTHDSIRTEQLKQPVHVCASFAHGFCFCHQAFLYSATVSMETMG